MQIKLDERLKAAASLVRAGSTVADIGSDHALLACWLWQNGWTDIIASDINPKPLESARKTAENCKAGIKLILSDGFENLPLRDDIIIAGMGGETIAEILSNCKHKNENTRFILQPMTRHEVLRRELYLQGFEIISEMFALSRNKPYTVIYARFTGKAVQINDAFAFTGKQENPVYISHQLNKIKKLAKGEPRYHAVAAEIEQKGKI
ncbi:MAG: class I SAM-dependent methyltransferase [Oscillospiraceae bacterium]|nr:class I SAM-dependent methyltransferase [Oscillospiraceae bacterium]